METLDQSLTSPSNEGRDLHDILENGYDISVGEIVGNAVSIYRENFNQLFVTGLLTSLIGGAGGPFTQPQMLGGFHKVMANREKGGDTSSNTLFKGFDEFGDQLVGNLLFVLILMIPMALFFILSVVFFGGGAFVSMGMESDAPMLGAQLMSFLLTPLFVASIFVFAGIFSFVVPLVAIGKMTGSQAIKTSWAVGKKQWLKLGLSQFLLALVSMLGLVLCFIGVYLTLPVQYIGNYLIYDQVFGTMVRTDEMV